jgi:transposase
MARPAGGAGQMEFGVSPISAVDAHRAVGHSAGGLGENRGCSRYASNDRFHHRPGASSRSRRKGGIQRNALGRSRGGFSTKIHLRTNAEGLPIGTTLTAGEAHDLKGYEALMNEDAPDPKVLLADRGYDSDAVRADVERRGGVPMIPTKKNRRMQIAIDSAIYALRNRIERCFNRLKNARRVATRYDKLADTFLGFIHLVAVRLWLRHFVNAT